MLSDFPLCICPLSIQNLIQDECQDRGEHGHTDQAETGICDDQEAEKEVRMKAFQGYQVNDELLAAAKPGCMVQHCLPAHRGEEITEEVFEANAGPIFDEAENRLHAQKAVMVTLMKD